MAYRDEDSFLDQIYQKEDLKFYDSYLKKYSTQQGTQSFNATPMLECIFV